MRRFVSLALLVLLTLAPTLADSPAKSRRAYRLLQVRQHLAVPAAPACTDVDGDSTTDPELKTGDICVDSDDEELCFYAGGEMHCLSGTGVAATMRQTPILHDDFLQVDSIANASMGTAQTVESSEFRWWWHPSNITSSSAMLEPGTATSSDGHLGVLKFVLGDNDDGGLRSPGSGEDRPFQVVPGDYSKLTLYVLLKLDASGTSQPADIQAHIGLCAGMIGGDCSSNKSAVIEFLSNTGQFKDPAYGHIYCWKSSTESYHGEFSTQWPVDENWHRWQIEWDTSQSKVTFYRDGTEVGSCTTDYFDPTTAYYVVPFTAETGNNPPADQTVYIDYVQLVAEPASSTRR